jgi:hypothetical protein
MTNAYNAPNTTDNTQSYASEIDNGMEVFERGCGNLFHVSPQASPNMTMLIGAGVIYNYPGEEPIVVASQSSPTLAAPSGNPRIDVIALSKADGTVSIIAGTEAASPSAPAILTGLFPVAEVYLSPGHSSIVSGDITNYRITWFSNLNEAFITSMAGDTTPQLGGDLDVQANEIISTSTNHIALHSNADVDLTLGDAAGVNLVNIRDSANSVVASVNSDGDIDGTDMTIEKITFATGVSSTAILDEDNMAGDSNSKLASQQSIKAYTDANTTGSDWVKVSQTTLSATASAVSFTGLSTTYSQYRIALVGVGPTTSDVGILVTTSTNNGSSYDTGASDYQWARWDLDTGSATTSSGHSTAAANISVRSAGSSNGCGNTETMDGTISVVDPAVSGYTHVYFHSVWQMTGGEFLVVKGSGYRASTTVVNAIQLAWESGNFRGTGTVTLYGYKA